MILEGLCRFIVWFWYTNLSLKGLNRFKASAFWRAGDSKEFQVQFWWTNMGFKWVHSSICKVRSLNFEVGLIRVCPNTPQPIDYRFVFSFFPSYSALRNLYAHCIQSPEGQHVGCITDLMPDGSYLTVPVYATICSAMCYESKENMERVKKCPYPGFRKHDPILSKLF